MMASNVWADDLTRLDSVLKIKEDIVLLLPSAVVTCVIYLMICSAIDLAIIAAIRLGWLGMVGIGGWPLRGLLAIIWYGSLLAALRLYGVYWRAKLPH
jgi:hypothetical protein